MILWGIHFVLSFGDILYYGNVCYFKIEKEIYIKSEKNKYEKRYGRQTEIVCDDENISAIVYNVISNPETIENSSLPTGDEFVYHATDIKATQTILSGGKLLSAEKVYGKSAEQLSFEKRDSLWNDPPARPMQRILYRMYL